MEPHPKKLNIENIRAIKILGKGAMGTVFLAHDRSCDPECTSPFALKVVEKALLHLKHHDADRRARWEMSVLSSINHHPYLPTLLGSFETHDLMGWAVPFCPGGDLNALRYHQNDRVFSSSAIKFYLAQIVCALYHLHSMGIAYRDLKPENVLVQASGHVTLTDFDLSRRLIHHRKKNHGSVGSTEMDNIAPFRELRPPPPPPPPRRNNMTRILSYGVKYGPGTENGLRKAKSARVSPRRASFAGGKRSNSFVGTEEYVSPEVVRGEGHEFGVDWWALGILAYEMLYGKTPFRGNDRKETFRNVLTKRPEFLGQRTALIDLIDRLLEKDPSKRLGHFKGAEEIKEHEFFKGLRWDLLTGIERPPVVPPSVEVDLTKCVTFDVREYFNELRAPPSLLPSPGRSLSSLTEEDVDVSLTEF
ncbi:serine/threonine-protein kinase UCN-like [Amaranthus tricolor]|uniref:serine/threonine-protein kinase UCN-like n=1 Tax=Amaranthus tricolor TaxID=29722 RepID=UPI0025895930|nr:serine/threonine-protein kinase UCN-like [Amaranthus tricolor]